MNKLLIYISTALLVLAVVSCNEDQVLEDWVADNPILPAETGDAGDLDFSNYVAIGNSLTAGFADGALYPEGQASSYPSILATQFSLVGGGDFIYPNITSGNGYGGESIGKAYIDVEAALLNPANAIQFTIGTDLTQNTETSLNNFGVPGARMIDATEELYGLGNPFFAKFNSAPGTASMLDDAVAANPTFFSVWLGSNDVLGYASSGGTDEADITSAGDFQAELITVLASLSAGGADGVILNVPPVTLAPFFQIVTTLSGGVNVLPAGSIDVATAEFLNSGAAYGEYNDGLGAAKALGLITDSDLAYRTIEFTGDVANSPVITDEGLEVLDISAAFMAPPGTVVLPQIRQAGTDPVYGITDVFPLTALSAIGVDPEGGSAIQGVAVPLPDQYTLTSEEQLNVITGYATYNAIISGVLESFPNVTLVDIGPMFADTYGLSAAQAAGLQLSTDAQEAADGVIGTEIGGYDMVPLSLEACCLFNSLWSADGIHPNSRGAAVVANEIIKALNAAHETSILEVDVLNYTGINAVL